MPVDNWEGQLISAEEFDRLEAMYHPLAHAVRQLIDATVRTGSSCSTVPMPVSTAQARARQAWPSARAAGEIGRAHV